MITNKVDIGCQYSHYDPRSTSDFSGDYSGFDQLVLRQFARYLRMEKT